MLVVERISDLRKAIDEAKLIGRTVGLVPTMGALHEGHLSLVKASKDAGDFTVVSIFVNPTQFAPTEDLQKYPRPFEADTEKCEEAGVDIIFHPSVEEMYPAGFSTYINVEGPLTELWEGVSRPTHFRGVVTICAKLFAVVEPERAYFGMKDYQQLKVIQKMVRELNIPLNIIPVPIVRENDGLAMSSRNIYLNPQERKAALVLYRSLLRARDLIESKETNAEIIRQFVHDTITAEPLATEDYIAVADPETLQPVEKIKGRTLIALAVRIGKTRLIDNMLIKPNKPV